MDQLSTTEATSLATHEATIDRGLRNFVEVGRALKEIRDGRLYRVAFGTFDEYLESRWSLSESRAKQFIVASEVEEEVAPETATIVAKTAAAAQETPLPAKAKPSIPSESVARAVAAAAPKGKRAEVWKEAVATAPKNAKGDPKVTAAHVQKVAARRKEPAAPPPEPEQPAPAQPGIPFVAESAAVDAVLDYIESQLRQLSKLLDATKADKKCKAAFAHFIPYLGGIGAIGGGVDTIRQNLPGAVHATPPGYIPRRSVEQRANYAKGGK